ncbi:MAG TPA: serine hydrolase [Steroidobacteraceae bacterium]|nr:serine hydrolase [Steroidobacteraceae bacterium]
MSALTDHLWQSLLFFTLVCALAAMTRARSTKVRLWLWRIAAVKWLVPFSVLGAIGAWFGFPIRYAGDPPPRLVVKLVDDVSPWFSASGWFDTAAARVAATAMLVIIALAAMRWLLGNIHDDALRARVEDLRLETDPDDREPSLGFFRAALFTACALIVGAMPLLSGAVRASVHAHDVLDANTQNMTEARVTIRPAKKGSGSRFFVDVNADGVTIRNVSVRELTALAYGVNRLFVRGDHFRDGPEEDWLVDTRHDVRIDARVLEPDHFDTYALRNVITRELATTFGLEIYLNNTCQKPCGKWGDRVLLQVTPDSWALVDEKQAAPPAQPVSEFVRKKQPARALFREFLAAFNSADREVLTKFVTGNVSAAARAPNLDETLALLKQTGGFEILELEERGPTELKGWVRARDSDALMAVYFAVESEPPYWITSYRFEWGTPPKQYFPVRLPEINAIRAVRAEAASRGAAGKFSGALLVARDKQVLVRGAYGLANRETQQDNHADTRFRIAAVTKMFTAVAVLRLVQEGKVRLGDPISKYVPEINGKPLARATIHQLLTHTSGAADFLGSRYDVHHLDMKSLQDYIEWFGVDELVAAPGKRYYYSNFGYLLLGRLVEQASRRSYYDYVQDVVFGPAGMANSGFDPEDVDAGRAEIYERPAGTGMWINAKYVLDRRATSAAHAYSTVDDLHRFVMALRGYRLLDAAHTRMMLEPQQRIWPGNDYGYGAMILSYEWTGRWIGHAGGYTGMDAQLWFSPDTGYTVIALSNMDPPAAQQMSDYVTARLPLTPERPNLLK